MTVAYKSEIRGVHITDAVAIFPHDWNVIAETCAGYSINLVTVLALSNALGGPLTHEEWIAFINAFHSRNIKVYVSYHIVGDIACAPEYRMVDSGGNYVDWNCASNPDFRNAVKIFIEHIASTYDIDGIMFDYARYPDAGTCYCQYCKTAFQEWLGETIPDSNWAPNPSDFAPGGSRYNEFMEWRVIPITNLVRDIRNWMLAVKPNLKFTSAAWTLFGYAPGYSPTYWRYWIGQDTADWIAKGYLDMVFPMMYTSQLTGEPESIETEVKADKMYWTGVPLVAFLRNDITTPENFKKEVDLVRSLGCDGWIIWRYGGPGIETTELTDITPYLDLIEISPPPTTITPWSGQLDEGTYRVTMPQQVQVGSDVYNFKQWEDGSTNPVRTIDLTSDTTITATYVLQAPPISPVPVLLFLLTVLGGIGAVISTPKKGGE
jgi:hypothetical protein